MNETALQERKICFYGAGSMAEAIVRGLLERKTAEARHISMINRSNQARLAELRARYGVETANESDRKQRMLQEADVIVLAMKPKDAAAALRELQPLLTERQLLVSVIAGMSIGTMERLVAGVCPIVRAMPNTSSTIGLGATGLSFSAKALDEQRRLAVGMFEAVGTVAVVPERQIDILTGVSGSGPAYVYYMMEAMIEAGVQGGLSPEQARELTVQTFLGAAQMVRTTGEHPADLRRKVTSPNGTTQAAIEVLQHHHFSEAVIGAVHRSAERAGEIGSEIGRESI